MNGYIFLSNHDITKHAFGKSRKVRCIKFPDGKENADLKYEVGCEYVAQSTAPGSDNWDNWIVALVITGDLLDGFVFSKKELHEYFEFID